MTIIRIIRISPNLRIIRMKTIMRIMRICANTANDDTNKNKLKNKKSKVKTGHRMSKGHPMSQIFINKKAK